LSCGAAPMTVLGKKTLSLPTVVWPSIVTLLRQPAAAADGDFRPDDAETARFPRPRRCSREDRSPRAGRSWASHRRKEAKRKITRRTTGAAFLPSPWVDSFFHRVSDSITPFSQSKIMPARRRPAMNLIACGPPSGLLGLLSFFPTNALQRTCPVRLFTRHGNGFEQKLIARHHRVFAS